jgi:hypothetical protein
MSILESIMKNLFKSALLPAAICLCHPFSFAAEGDKSIYGADDRQEYYQAPAPMRQLADSVVSLWASERVIPNGQNLKLTVVNFGTAENLCPTERFREQPKGAFCSGSLVGEDLVMTAGHCIEDQAECADTKIVFGFNIKAEGGNAATTLPMSEVYGCKTILKREKVYYYHTVDTTTKVNFGPDYALIQLDRKVSGHKPLEINRNQNLAKGSDVFVIGHPKGLPLKVAGGAKIRDASPQYFFVTDLDTYIGSSGSPVFSSATGLIEGVLFDGGKDFMDSPVGCKYSYRVGQEQGRGESVTKISIFAGHIPNIKAGPGGANTSEFKDMELNGVYEAVDHPALRGGIW